MCGALIAFLILVLAPSAQAGGFGFKPGSEGFDFAAEEASGAPAEAAGTHPYRLTATVNFTEGPEEPGQPGVPFPAADVKDMRFELPSGLIGNPSVVTRCTLAQFNTPRQSPFEPSASGESCPEKSQLGIVTIRTSLQGGTPRSFGLFNLTPPPGTAAELGAAPFGEPLAFAGRVRNRQGEYGLEMEARNLPQGLPILGIEVALWGVPWDASHDPQRGDCLNESEPAFGWGKCSVGPPKTNDPLAFLTLPASCQGPLPYLLSADSWQQPGRWVGDAALSRDAAGEVAGLRECAKLSFSTFSFSGPTSNRASTATGYDFDLTVNQEGLTKPSGIAGPQVQKALVSLPEGFTINPSMGAGLGVCTPAQFARETPTSTAGKGCPNESKIGTLRVQSPLVIEETTSFEQIVNGSIYLAQPFHNPFGALIGLYLIARAPNGIFVKVSGELIADQATGRLTARFEGLPQLPYTHLLVHFREGQRAPLATPASCGAYLTEVELTPWQDEEAVAPVVEHQNFEFHISQGAGGGPCPAPGAAPFEPRARSGSVNSQAGAYSPYYLHLTRTDTEQEITSYSAQLPPGLTGKLAGLSYCPDQAIEAAKRESGVGERERPSCPAASEVGHTLAGFGLGGVLDYAPGRLYLAGPYRGAPLSIVAIDSALVGPFDLGVIVVRSAIRIDPHSAQVSLDTQGENPFPHIVDGIPIHLRDIRVYISRPNFTLNPTSCERFTPTSTLSGSNPPFTNPADVLATAPSFYQVANCSSLGFKPRISLRLAGKTKRGAFPALHATVEERGGDANIGYAAVALPHAEFLAQEHINTVCTAPQFEANHCPAGAIYGHARAITPLLPEPLEGPVYLLSGAGHLLPDLVAALKGDGGIAIDVEGRVNSVNGGMQAIYEILPDAPASRFEMTLYGGRRGLLVNSTDVCASPGVASARFGGQNHASEALRVPLKAGCKKHHKPPKHRKHRRRG